MTLLDTLSRWGISEPGGEDAAQQRLQEDLIAVLQTLQPAELLYH
jgi:hypothetical protein